MPGQRLPVLLLLLAGAVGAQTTWYVQGSGVPGGAGTAASPFGSIQQGIAAAAGGDLVLVRPGTYLERLDLLGKAIEVRGELGAAATILDAGQIDTAVRCVNGETSATVLRSLTIRNGRPAGGSGSAPQSSGGGVRCSSCSPTFVDCTFTGNLGGVYGGGATVLGGAPTFSGCWFQGNSAVGFGGGIFITNGAVLLLNGCTFQQNASDHGGAVSVDYSLSGSVTATGCVFQANSAAFGAGGAIWAGSVSLTDCAVRDNQGMTAAVATQDGTMIRCEFSGNAAHPNFAAALQCLPTLAPVTVSECVFTGNRGGTGAVHSAGAILPMRLVNCLVVGNTSISASAGAVAGATIELLHCTIAANDGWYPNPGAGAVSAGPTSTITNCVIWGNTATPIAPNSGVTVTFSDIEGGWPGAGNISANPLFAGVPSGDFHLLPGSPCRDAGALPAGRPFTDYEGHPRVWGAAPDLGADEYVPALSGSGDDFALTTTVNGRGEAVGTHPALPGHHLALHIAAPNATLLGGAVFGAASFHPNGTSPGPNPSLPSLWIDLGAFFFFLDPSVLPGGLPAAGVSVAADLPASLSGTTLRLQAIDFHPQAGNGFALTDAHDILIF